MGVNCLRELVVRASTDLCESPHQERLLCMRLCAGVYEAIGVGFLKSVVGHLNARFNASGIVECEPEI